MMIRRPRVEGYRVELPQERITAEFDADSTLTLTPELDSEWEAGFCRVAEQHSRVRAYVKNHHLGFEVPYRFQAAMRIYRPDFIVRIDDGYGDDDLLNLVVEIKGYRVEDAKKKKTTMDTQWVPGVNRLASHGRWAFAEFTDVYAMQHDFARALSGPSGS